MHEFDHLIGLSESDARALAAQDDYSLRVLAADGELFMGTMDINPRRINVALEEGVVVSIMKLG